MFSEGYAFGRYQILSKIGQGGMGQVYKAYDTATNREVALKILPFEFAASQEFRERFQRESKLVAGLSEPHVIPIHAFGELDGQLYLDMRLVDATDAQSLLTTSGALEITRAVSIVEQVAAALDAAHASGVEHRDVKPANILLADRDFVYLIDFGIARAAGETGLTSTGMAVGTFAYMAPERFSTSRSDHRADVYSLACVLYQLLTGDQPFPGVTVEQQIAGHLHLPPPIPSERQPSLPPGIDEVVACGMAKNPDARYSTAGELADAAYRALRGERIAALAPTEAASRQARLLAKSSPNEADPNRRRRAAMLAAFATALAVAVASVGVMLTRDRDRSHNEARTPAALTAPTKSTAPPAQGRAVSADPNGQQAVQVVGFTQIGNEVSVRLHNPNAAAGLIRSPYELTLLDEAGAVIATQGQEGLPGTYVNTIYHLPPNSDYGLKMTAPQGRSVASVEFATRGDWLDWASVGSPSVTVTNPAIQDQSSTFGPTTTGRITLDKGAPSDVLVTSFINTDKGAVVTYVMVDCVKPDQPRAFEASSFMEVGGPFEIDTVVAYPMEVEGAPGWHPATC
ncbi:serine/threonine-protein kinase [Mycolicibacter heraklionensis]|uniref:serine/threonine-protein kinase n=1 Tax=Mycolicibacter heraklionensis TaxID=512402 RepID=UPI0009EF56D6|nr:serine/threonine-protein kinase [Mycolicibacter heraklionensis]